MPSSERNPHEKAASIASALADPLRLAILHRLMEGPASVSEMVSVTREPQPKVSNHLAVLRDQGLVLSRRSGRQVAYGLRNPSVAQLVEALATLSGRHSRRPPAAAAIAEARTCYDHLAGRVGVAILDALRERGTLKATRGATGDLRLGPAASDTFGSIGVDIARPPKGRRRFAFACLDWTERRPHLGGALGAALCSRAFETGWVERIDESRAVRLTKAGRAALRSIGA